MDDILLAYVNGSLYGSIGAVISFPIYRTSPDMYRTWIYHPLVSIVLRMLLKVIGDEPITATCVKLHALTGIGYASAIFLTNATIHALVVAGVDRIIGIRYCYITSVHGIFIFIAIMTFLHNSASYLYRVNLVSLIGGNYDYVGSGYIVTACAIYLTIAGTMLQ